MRATNANYEGRHRAYEGRHRLGTPGLIHCVEFRPVAEALAEYRGVFGLLGSLVARRRRIRPEAGAIPRLGARRTAAAAFGDTHRPSVQTPAA